MLDPQVFLSDFGIRSLSKAHGAKPFVFEHLGQRHKVPYTPGEAITDMFGGNTNWRGPIWFPTNFLIIEALDRYHYFQWGFVQDRVPHRIGTTQDAARSGH